MHENEHLAIASVPIQQWGQVYDEKEALKNGTVFPALNKPFFVTEQGPSGNHPGMESRGTNPNSLRRESKSASPEGALDPETAKKRQDMLLAIQQVSFTVDDVRLYMDTHPADMQGLTLLKKMIQRRKELLKEYAFQFEPLTMDCMADIYAEYPDSGCYCWQKGPSPWEGACV